MALNIDDWITSNVVSGIDPMMSSSSSSQHVAGGQRLLNGQSSSAASASTTTTVTNPIIKSSGSEPDLFSRETLDRSSPDLWPEQIPGVTEFVARSQSPLLSTYGNQTINSHQSTPSGRMINTTTGTLIGSSNDGHRSNNNLFGSTSNKVIMNSSQNSNRHRDGNEWLGLKDPLTPEEMQLIQGFGNLNSVSLYEKVRELQDLAYQLGMEESKEMSRGTLLNVLLPSGHQRRRDNVENIEQRKRSTSQSSSGKRMNNRKGKLSTDKRLFFTDSDGQGGQVHTNSSDLSALPTLLDQSANQEAQDVITSVQPSMPSLQMIPNLDSDSNPSSPFRSLRSSGQGDR